MAHFLRFEDTSIGKRLEGDAALEGYKDQIEVLAWTWGVVQPRLVSRPHRTTPARAEFEPLSFVHRKNDGTSPGLVFAAAAGSLIDSATLSSIQVDGDGALVEYSRVEMEEIFVATASQSDDASGEGSEDVTLTFKRAIYSVWEIDEKGGQGDQQKVVIDLKAAKYS